MEKLAAAAHGFAAAKAPIEALRSWLLLFVDCVAQKHIIAPALNSVAGGPSRLYEGSCGLVQGAIEELVKSAVQCVRCIYESHRVVTVSTGKDFGLPSISGARRCLCSARLLVPPYPSFPDAGSRTLRQGQVFSA